MKKTFRFSRIILEIMCNCTKNGHPCRCLNFAVKRHQNRVFNRPVMYGISIAFQCFLVSKQGESVLHRSNLTLELLFRGQKV